MSLISLTLAEPQHFSLWERLLLVALLILSGVLFWRRFGLVLQKILRSRKDPDFHLHPVGKRVWYFFWEVLCQAKVIRERPLPGLAHAFVFWGFCAFALVTLNHFAAGFGIGFLDPSGPIGRFYFYLAAAFAVACAVGIIALFIRRFFVRPLWLGKKVSFESGVIAFLIFALMATYLACFLRLRCFRGRAPSLVDAYSGTARLSAHHSPHQAPASRAQPGHCLSLSRQASARSRRSPAMKTSVSSQERT